MSRTVLVLALALAVTAAADEKPTPAQRLAAIQKEAAAAEAALRDAVAKLPETPGGEAKAEKLFKEYRDAQQARCNAALEIARADPKSETGFRALEWLLLTPQAYYRPHGKPALGLMTKHHAGNPKIGKAVAMVSFAPPHPGGPGREEVSALLRAVAAKNPDRAARGNAAWGLAQLEKNAFTLAESRGKPGADALAKKAEQAFEAILKEYGTCPFLRSRGDRPATTLADQVKPELVELRLLRIGKPALDTQGEDLDGVKFKLSDYRGKVVLLVFWASWCGPCMREVPHERELVERFKGRPFALIGVNGDDKKEDAGKAVTKYKITWRSFSSGEQGPGGPIAKAWNVHGWPTVYVIDPQGVIRHKYLHGKRLDKPLEDLVAAAEAAAEKAR
jgi:peroxiredoxin